MKEITVQTLKELIQANKAPHLIDVREPHEHDEFNLGGQNIPVTELPFRIAELKSIGEEDIILYCQSGSRSSLAQKLLEAQFNITNTTNVLGGVKAWKAAFED